MGEYWKLLGEYTAETTAYTGLTGGVASSPYTPDESAILTGLRAIPNRSAATTLINHVQFKLSCTTFKPNSIEVGCQGSGLQTAPANMSGAGAALDWSIMQKVTAGVPITIEARCVTADTPVTVSVLLYGKFAS